MANQQKEVISLLRQQNHGLERQIKDMQQRYQSLERKPKQAKAKLDQSTNYENMLENAKKILKQASRDKQIYQKRVAKDEDQKNADELRKSIGQYKEELEQLKKQNIQMKRKQQDNCNELRDEHKKPQNFNRMQEELKFYRLKNQTLEESLQGYAKVLDSSKTKTETYSTKLTSLSPNQSPTAPRLREKEIASRLKSRSVVKGLQTKVNIANRSLRTMTNGYTRRIQEIEKNIQKQRKLQDTINRSLEGRATQHLRAKSQLQKYHGLLREKQESQNRMRESFEF